MKVLITGGYGYIGAYVAEKFYREGYDVFIIDNLISGVKESVTFRHKSFFLDVKSSKCEELFKANRFDLVVHLAGNSDIEISMTNPNVDSESNVTGLTNLLHLSSKYGVKRFIYASSVSVYGETSSKAHESSPCNPVSSYGFSKKVGEYYCSRWQMEYGLPTLALRISNVYGLRLGFHNQFGKGVISHFIQSANRQLPFTVYGDGNQTRDFIHVTDVATAIYRAALCDETGEMNIAAGVESTIHDVISIIERFVIIKGFDLKETRTGDINRTIIDNQKAIHLLDWVPKYTLEEGIEKSFRAGYESKTRKKMKVQKRKSKELIMMVKDSSFLLPFIENILLFLVFLLIDSNRENLYIGFDSKIIYILLVGILFGKIQSMIACFLTVSLFFYWNLQSGKDLIALFYENDVLIQVCSYILIALVIGYATEKRKLREERAISELEVVEQKYDFLHEVFEETKLIKDELQTQILYSEDSLGKLYSIVQELDSLETFDVFHSAVLTLERFLNTHNVSIYNVIEKQQFVRLVAKSNNADLLLPSASSYKGIQALEDVIQNRHFYFNHDLKKELPIMMAPIVSDGKTVAIVCINEMQFENLSLYYQNLFRVMIQLISSSVSRAIKFENSTFHERYLPNSFILKSEYFARAVASKEKARQKFNIPYTILEIRHAPHLSSISTLVRSSLRDTDILGVDEHNRLFILLFNTEGKQANVVIQRLRALQLDIVKEMEDEIYV